MWNCLLSSIQTTSVEKYWKLYFVWKIWSGKYTCHSAIKSRIFQVGKKCSSFQEFSFEDNVVDFFTPFSLCEIPPYILGERGFHTPCRSKRFVYHIRDIDCSSFSPFESNAAECHIVPNLQLTWVLVLVWSLLYHNTVVPPLLGFEWNPIKEASCQILCEVAMHSLPEHLCSKRTTTTTIFWNVFCIDKKLVVHQKHQHLPCVDYTPESNGEVQPPCASFWCDSTFLIYRVDLLDIY